MGLRRVKMDINKIRESMKILKDECKKYKKCEDCTLNDPQNKSCILLEKEPDKWDEEKIVENNCTTFKVDDIDEWYQEVLRCTSCNRVFMIDERDEGIIGCYCPYCGKKIVNKEEEEDEE
jgi:DNA-directed RNA polymerase subunit RPC12/RpoP